MCRDAVLGKSVFKQTDPSALFSPFAASLLPPFHFSSPLSLPSSLPPSTLCSPPFKSYVWPCACPELAPSPGETRFDLKFWEDDD